MRGSSGSAHGTLAVSGTAPEPRASHRATPAETRALVGPRASARGADHSEQEFAMHLGLILRAGAAALSLVLALPAAADSAADSSAPLGARLTHPITLRIQGSTLKDTLATFE